MEVFLHRIRQLLPVLGSDILIPVGQPTAKQQSGGTLFCRMKGAEGRGHRTPDGFVVLKGSTAVLQERQKAHKWPASIALRKQLIADGTLIQKDGFYEFGRDVEFSSPSAAAVIEGGSANGLIGWKTQDGRALKDLDEQAKQAVAFGTGRLPCFSCHANPATAGATELCRCTRCSRVISNLFSESH
jgi:hypothetical protein